MGSSWPQVFCIAIAVSTLLLSHPQQAAGELQFLGERPFRAYASRLTPAGREIYQLFAIDGVSGNSNGITFQFEETFALQPASRLFRLNSTTGELILNQVFSYLVDYVLAIEAHSSSRTTVVRANITVTVVAESDSTPRYELENYNFSISEDISLNRPFSVVRAFSLPPSSFQNYAIIGGTSERNFAVDSDSGLLTVTRSLDREVVDTYTLILRYSCSTVYIDTLILIHVLDANDNSPQFSEIVYVVMILESTSVSTSVLTILATDADAGSNAIVSYSLMNEALLPFSLNPQSGVLLTTSELDYERVEEYYLMIIALDGGELPRSSTVTVIVSLSNVDDECPIFENPFYSIEIPSSPLTSNQVILTITATDPDRAGDIRYSITSSNDDGNVLSLDPMTGDISLANDNLGSVRGHYSLNVSASDESCSTFVQVDIGIGDENNHNPSFDTPCSASLSENPPLGTEIVTLTAIDGDVGQNGVITYTLVNTSFFSIDASSGVVRTTRSPHEYDRELQVVFRVGVIARDEKQGQDYCLLTITLLDQNDNRPQFNLPSYNFTLPSDSEVGTFLAQIWAYDEDRGENGTVVYSLSSTEMLFSIDENNGTITTMAGLGNVGYTFQVTATDTGQPTSLSSTAMVHVTPLTGNSFPVFNQLYYSTSLCENAPVHYTVLSVSASMFPEYEIIPGQNYDTNSIEGPFIISSSIIRVGSSVLVDYERLGTRKIFHFPVQAFNEGGSSFSIVEISVIDLDDNPPVIEEIRSFTLAENQPVGTKILQVLATDLDSGSNGNIAYNISINSPYFSVSSNGTITSSYRFDFENSSEVHSGTLRIEAYNPSQTDATIDMCGFGVFLLHERGIITISWSILDQNDNSPRFSQQMYFITLSEDQQIGNPIFSFTATDPDSSDGDGLIFMIRGGNDGRFAVESDMLLLVQRLDYEVKSNYSLIIEVTDGVHSGPTCADCRATLVINILNIDDEKPVFSAPFYYGEVEESAPLGTTVLTLLAHDPDSASISYRLSGSAEGRFSVTRSGDIVVSGLLDREEFPGGSIAFLATAESGGADVTEVNVTLLDVNDHAPRFLDVFGGRVQENVPQTAEDEGIFVVQVRASDLDQGRNGTVTYSLVSGMEDGFRIDPDSGILTAHAEYDREAQPFHNVIVRATDNGLPTSLSTTTLVTVDIGDDNDNPPFFPFTFMFARIFEEAPIGSHVFSIPAVDLDNGTNASITYTLMSSDPSGRFELDSETGEVRVTQKLDYEVPLHRSTTLTIRISDPVFQGEMEGSLLIMLLDRNDNPPRVDPPVYTMGGSDIRENLPPGRGLARFTAVDDDEGENGNLIFSILNGNERGDFEISDTGEVRNLNTLDYEAVTRYNLTVLVSDQGTPPLSTAVQLEFNILDENDNPPTFSQPVYSVSVTEETQLSAPDILLQVTASDPDTGDGGTVQSYSIVSGDDSMRFHLNSTTGILSTSAVFDREELSSYSLIITANDRGIDSQTGTGMILVTITDINDTPSEEGGLLQVYIYARDGVISPRTIGPVYFADPDTSNSFEDCVVQDRNAQVFETLGCDVVLDQPNPPTIANELNLAYTMTVQGDDGGGHVTVTADVVIMVDHISSSNIPGDDIVTITINATDKEYFTEGLNISLPSLLAQYLGTERSNLYVISVQQGFFDMTNTVDMTFSARKISGEFMSAVEIIDILFLARNELFVGQYGVVSIPTDPCVTEPCFNQAECRIQRSVGETERTILTSQFILFSPLVTLSYQCDCVPGTAGRLCEINYSDCYSNPCSHGVECTDAVQGFICDCPEGTSGSDCSFNPDECSPRNPCLNGATCTNGFGTYVCECLPGYYGSECQYAHFQISSSCDSVSCQNGAACSPGRDGFTCLCPFGFSGEFCEEPVLIQGGCLRNPCYNGSSCTNSDDGPICHCSAGFTGPFCRWPLDNCELEPCQNGGTCEEGLYGSYVCTCPPGYTGTDCTDRVSACESNPCVNGGRCTEKLQIDSFSCQCSRFFTGSRCETSLITLDLCDEFLCSDFSNCTSSRDSYTCSCDPGYYGTDCSMTSDTSSSICSSNPCLHGGTCTLTGGNDEYICQCSNGFTGSNCEINIDDCNPDPCLNGGTCQDRIGGYICNCTEEGVTGNSCEVFCPAGQEGEFCERTIQYCTVSSCLNNGTCIEVTGASACQCPQTHTGARCELNNSCATTQCLNGGACTNIPSGGSSCDCMPGFDGENCKLFTASFSGSASVSSFRALRPLQLQGQGEMTMEFTTMSQQGLLLYSTQYQGGMSRDLIAIEVVGGYLKISVSHGSGAGSATVMSSSVHVSDGRWHQVALQTNGKVSDTIVIRYGDKGPSESLERTVRSNVPKLAFPIAIVSLRRGQLL